MKRDAFSMRIRSYGARGSVPVSGSQHLKYGGDTTCVEIQGRGGATIIVDAGSGMRRLGDALIEDGRLNIHLLFTHCHWDHIIGFTVFKPNYLDDFHITIWHHPGFQGDVRTVLEKLMHPPGFPIRFNRLKAGFAFREHALAPFAIDTVQVHPIAISHTQPGLGYRFEEDGKRFVMITDNELGYTHPHGHTAEHYARFARGADLLFHDAHYTDDEYPRHAGQGHSSCSNALGLALAAGVQRFGLFHHGPDRTDADVDLLVARCRERIAAAGSPMDCFAVGQDTDILL